MPQSGISTEWVACREDEIARFLTARDHVSALRRLLDLLYRRQMITTAYYQDGCDSLDYLTCVLLIGKKNTALLRKLPPT